MRGTSLVFVAMLIVAGCSGDEPAQTAEVTVVALTFDGTSCQCDGPAQVPEGTVDFRFVNTSGAPFAVSVISVEDYALEDFLREGPVGGDWDIPFGHPRGGGIKYHNRWPQVAPGEAQEYDWTLPAGTYYLDCVLELDHVWRTAQLEVVTAVGDAANAATQPAHIMGGDVLLAIEPGPGSGAEAEMLLGTNYGAIEEFGVAEGIADYVARGANDIAAFTAPAAIRREASRSSA